MIDPGRAFGTGAHPTTRLCVELLAAEARRAAPCSTSAAGRACSSIAAARLGFGPVDGARQRPGRGRDDPRERARQRGRRSRRATADALRRPAAAADLGVANVLLAPVEAILAPTRGTARDHVRLPRRRPSPRAGAGRRVARRELDGWAADVFVRERPADRSADSTV